MTDRSRGPGAGGGRGPPFGLPALAPLTGRLPAGSVLPLAAGRSPLDLARARRGQRMGVEGAGDLAVADRGARVHEQPAYRGTPPRRGPGGPVATPASQVERSRSRTPSLARPPTTAKSGMRFDPAWGTPPDTHLGRWDPARRVYEPAPPPPELRTNAAVMRRYREILRRADLGEYIQAYQTDDRPGVWQHRWVRVRTDAPYDILEDIAPHPVAPGAADGGSCRTCGGAERPSGLEHPDDRLPLDLAPTPEQPAEWVRTAESTHAATHPDPGDGGLPRAGGRSPLELARARRAQRIDASRPSDLGRVTAHAPDRAPPGSERPPRAGDVGARPDRGASVVDARPRPRAPSGGAGSVSEPRRSRPPSFAITHFDPAWGTPPEMAGHRWNPQRFLYEPHGAAPLGATVEQKVRVQAEALARLGIYPQAHRKEDEPGRWFVRWVRTTTPVPSAGKPYDILESLEVPSMAQSQERDAAAMHAMQARHEAEVARAVARVARRLGRSSAEEGPGDPGAYSWVPQRDLPVGCPYPYSYLPVPRDDYVTGRWLEPDYVPSIPLPPPYDATPWQCGVPGVPGERKGRPEDRPITSMDIQERRQALLQMSWDMLTAREEELRTEHALVLKALANGAIELGDLSQQIQLDLDELSYIQGAKREIEALPTRFYSTAIDAPTLQEALRIHDAVVVGEGPTPEELTQDIELAPAVSHDDALRIEELRRSAAELREAAKTVGSREDAETIEAKLNAIERELNRLGAGGHTRPGHPTSAANENPGSSTAPASPDSPNALPEGVWFRERTEESRPDAYERLRSAVLRYAFLRRLWSFVRKPDWVGVERLLKDLRRQATSRDAQVRSDAQAALEIYEEWDLRMKRARIEAGSAGGPAQREATHAFLEEAAGELREVLTTPVGKAAWQMRGSSREKGETYATRDARTDLAEYEFFLVAPLGGVFEQANSPKWKHDGEWRDIPEQDDPDWMAVGLLVGWHEKNPYKGETQPDFIAVLKGVQVHDGGSTVEQVRKEGLKSPIDPLRPDSGRDEPEPGTKTMKYLIEEFDVGSPSKGAQVTSGDLPQDELSSYLYYTDQYVFDEDGNKALPVGPMAQATSNKWGVRSPEHEEDEGRSPVVLEGPLASASGENPYSVFGYDNFKGRVQRREPAERSVQDSSDAHSYTVLIR